MTDFIKIRAKKIKKERRKYYINLDLSRATDNKMFWKTVKFLLSNMEKITKMIIKFAVTLK